MEIAENGLRKKRWVVCVVTQSWQLVDDLECMRGWVRVGGGVDGECAEGSRTAAAATEPLDAGAEGVQRWMLAQGVSNVGRCLCQRTTHSVGKSCNGLGIGL